MRNTLKTWEGKEIALMELDNVRFFFSQNKEVRSGNCFGENEIGQGFLGPDGILIEGLEMLR